MALSTVASTVRGEINFLLSGIFCQNVLHFRLTEGPLSAPFLVDLAEAIQDWMETFWMPIFSQDLVFRNVYIASEDFSAPLEYEGPFIGTAGGKAVETEPINVAMKTQFVTGLIGRSFKGRMFSPGLAVTDIGARVISPAHLLAAQAAIEQLPALLATANWEHVVVSRQQNLVQIDPAIATTVVLYQVQPFVGDMGRRIDN